MDFFPYGIKTKPPNFGYLAFLECQVAYGTLVYKNGREFIIPEEAAMEFLLIVDTKSTG